jgi:hypothetical protein
MGVAIVRRRPRGTSQTRPQQLSEAVEEMLGSRADRFGSRPVSPQRATSHHLGSRAAHLRDHAARPRRHATRLEDRAALQLSLQDER